MRYEAMSIALGMRIDDHGASPANSSAAPRASMAHIAEPDSRPFVAVGTQEGILVDKHLGEVSVFQIWKPIENGYMHLDDRIVSLNETGHDRWIALADALKDCRAVLVSGIGDLPEKVLAERSISIIEMNSFVTMGLDAVYLGQETVLLRGRRRYCSQGGRCSGRGGGCQEQG
jgi:nitrogen fixation protein NifB